MSDRAAMTTNEGRDRGESPSVRAGELAGVLGRPRTLVAYGDPAGRVHRITMRGRLVLDECAAAGGAAVVCELGEGEGVAQARACLVQGGYVERARSDRGGLCRELGEADVAPAAPQKRRAA